MNARQKRIPAGGVAEDMESIRTRSRLWSRGVPVADVILAEWVQADRDRAALLAEVDRIRAEMMKAQAVAEDATAAFDIQTERIDAARAVLRQESPTLEEVRAALFGDAP